MEKKILLAHGAGGRLSSELLHEKILPALDNEFLSELHDSAKIGSIAMTTDSYVIQPIFFRGGDIGKLAICGTVNDLAVAGAIPKYLSLALIIEEGFVIDDLEKILESISITAREANVKIVTGDTKVVEHGQVDGIFINTTGIGELIKNVDISKKNIQIGMKIIISGYIGDHSTVILAERHGLELPVNIGSDCAPLSKMISEILSIEPRIAMLRDITRGGLASVLNEIVDGMNFGILIDEKKIPVRAEVQSVCEILGFDVLELANEGKIVTIVPKESVEKILSVMHKNIYGRHAVEIGEIISEANGRVCLKTHIGSIRIVDTPHGEIIPRIC